MAVNATSEKPNEADATATPLLRAVDVHKHYTMGEEDLHVLRGVSVDVHRGEWLAILGASGSGKSTLLHLLGGLDHPDEGSVYFDGDGVGSGAGRKPGKPGKTGPPVDIFGLAEGNTDAYRNSQVGFVFQFYHLLPELTAIENVLIGAMVSKGLMKWQSTRAARKQRATELLSRLGLAERMSHRPSRLSGGERQRVAIARALVNEPAILLADEPTGNLDQATGEHILSIFKELHRQGQTIVMVTHDAKVADIADRAVTLVNGEFS